MGIDRRKRVSFEEVAELYDEVRPGYPEELVEDVVSLARIPTDGRILEIGCGPGNATVAFARRGYRIVGIELGSRLAAHAVRNCQAYPKVQIVNASFEDWAQEENAFDLAISADAFHWIPPVIGYPKAASALKGSGSAAFFWNLPVDPDTEWSRAIEEVYRMQAPEVDNPDKGFSLPWLADVIRDNFQASACFGEVMVRQYSFLETLTSESYIKLLRTYSGHWGMDETTREKLFEGILTILDGFGGSVEKPRSVALFLAKVKK
jgi:SAM-dependent methyltransferase